MIDYYTRLIDKKNNLSVFMISKKLIFILNALKKMKFIFLS